MSPEQQSRESLSTVSCNDMTVSCNGESPVQVRNCESVFGMFNDFDCFNNLLTSGMLSNPKKPGSISNAKAI